MVSRKGATYLFHRREIIEAATFRIETSARLNTMQSVSSCVDAIAPAKLFAWVVSTWQRSWKNPDPILLRSAFL